MSSTPTVVTLRVTPTDPKAFLAFLAEVLPETRKFKGCQSNKTYAGKDGGAEVLLVQEWDSIADQQAYLAWRESTGVLQKFLGHLAKPAEISVWTPDPA